MNKIFNSIIDSAPPPAKGWAIALIAILCLFSLGAKADDGASTGATTLKGSGTSADPYKLATKAEWNAFASKVNGGETGACAVMTANIDLGEGTLDGMIGTATKRFSGTFDGGGYTLKVNCTVPLFTVTIYFVAPFRFIKGATIKNLTTTGTFNNISGDFEYVSGM